MTRLSVNLNKIALLRNQRNIDIPSVIGSARTVIEAGAYGITIHPRPDQRHTRYADAYELSELLKTEYKNAEFNMEGNPFTGKYVELVGEIRPNQATLVPDSPDANTSDHGWNLQTETTRLAPVVKELKRLGIRVSVFMDADTAGIGLAGKLGADRIELYTEPYARAFRTNEKLDETLQLYVQAAVAARDIGLGVNAGHDLNLQNLGRFCSTVPGILEVSIGHALIAEAIETGLKATVKEYLKILSQN